MRETVGGIGVEVVSELYVVVMGRCGIKLGKCVGPWDMALRNRASIITPY